MAPGDYPIIPLKAAPRKKSPYVVASLEPLRLAEFYLARRGLSDDELLLMRRWRGAFWRFDSTRYRRVPDEVLDSEIYEVLDGAVYPKAEGDRANARVKPRRALVAEVRAALPSRGLLLDSALNAPFWLNGARRPVVDLVAVSNGLLDLSAGQLSKATPDLFVTHALPLEWNSHAPESLAWSDFLSQLWPDDDESVDTLQEWFGYCLVPDTSQQKIALLVGPKRSGKGTISRVLTGLLGAEAVASPTLGSLAGNFGLQPLLDRTLAIVNDARLSGRSDQATIAERLLSISGEDSIVVDRKHLPAISVRLSTRFMIATNELPRVHDTSGALASRFLVLVLRDSFLGREDHALTDRLLRELPGILVWAVEGWRRLRARGQFVQPQSGLDAAKDIDDLGSPVGAFVRDCCRVSPAARVLHENLFAAWKRWCSEQSRDHPGTAQTFARDLRTVLPHLRGRRWRLGSKRMRGYEGIELVSERSSGE